MQQINEHSWYRSSKNVVFLPKSSLLTDFLEFLKQKKKLYAHHLGRNVFLDIIETSLLSRSDVKHRLECFFVAIDILRHSKDWQEKYIDGKKCIEIKGVSQNEYLVFVHLREELEKGDKRLLLVSVFYKKKTSLL